MNRRQARERVSLFSVHAALTMEREAQRAWVQNHLDIAGLTLIRPRH